MLGFIVLFMARLPPDNSKRIDEEDAGSDSEAETLFSDGERMGGEQHED